MDASFSLGMVVWITVRNEEINFRKIVIDRHFFTLTQKWIDFRGIIYYLFLTSLKTKFQRIDSTNRERNGNNGNWIETV